MSRQKILAVHHLKMHFPFSKGVFKKVQGVVKAVDDVSFDVYEGETLGLVGESGCGKTTLGRCVMRVYKPTAGRIDYFPNSRDGSVDLARLDQRELKPYRRDLRMIFQDPQSSLNPRLTVLEIIGEALTVHEKLSGRALEVRVMELMERVGLRKEYLRRYPHAFSGGERQRIGIARALSLNPRLVVADEAVSALDVSVQAQTINLLEDLQEEFQLTYIFVAHDLSVVQHISDRVIVMYVGKMVEMTDTNRLYRHPRHPYTEALLSSVPIPDPTQRSRRERVLLEGDVADPAAVPPGCAFHPRCRYVQERCHTEIPEWRQIDDGHFVACHFAENLDLIGI